MYLYSTAKNIEIAASSQHSKPYFFSSFLRVSIYWWMSAEQPTYRRARSPLARTGPRNKISRLISGFQSAAIQGPSGERRTKTTAFVVWGRCEKITRPCLFANRSMLCTGVRSWFADTRPDFVPLTGADSLIVDSATWGCAKSWQRFAYLVSILCFKNWKFRRFCLERPKEIVQMVYIVYRIRYLN